MAAVQVDGDFVWETVYNPSAKEKEGKFAQGNKGPGTPGAERVGGRKGGKSNGPEDKKAGSGGKGKKWWKRAEKEKAQGGILPASTTDLEKEEAKIGEEKDKEDEKERPFELKNLNFVIPKGAFIGIIGKVGSGKVCADPAALKVKVVWLLIIPLLQSSVLQALIGEMRRTRGEVRDARLLN